MLRLKRLLFEIGLRQQDFARSCGLTRQQMNNILNGDNRFEPYPANRARIIHQVQSDPRAARWLAEARLPIDAIWDVVPDEFMGAKLRAKLSHYPAVVPGDPDFIQSPHKEAIMITQQALKHFRLFRNPFANDVNESRDIFLSQDHIFLKEMMLDTARHNGFTAVYGEVGSGKSIMRKDAVQELRSEGVRVLFPKIVDKARITPGSLIDAIIMDISEESPKRNLEVKTRQAVRLLQNRSASGLKQVLIVEEAHKLTVPAMKALKQIHEFEEGFAKLIGIIIIGQSELKFLLDETRHPELREVSRRVTIAEIGGLGEDVARYLQHKIARAGRHIDDLFTADAVEAITARLQTKDGRKVISKAYPLSVNNLAVNAINAAIQMGEPKVTAEVVLNV